MVLVVRTQACYQKLLLGGSFGDLFYKTVDLLNKIEDFLVKSWLLSKIVDLFSKLMDLLFRKGFFST